MMVEPLQTEGPMGSGYGVPMPSGDQTPFSESFQHVSEGRVRQDDQLPFPPGVKDLLHWGATHISWGKCKGMSYQEVLVSPKEEMKSYRTWILARIKSGDAKIRDLANYLQRAGAQDRGHLIQGETIPGSDEVRYFKKTDSH